MFDNFRKPGRRDAASGSKQTNARIDALLAAKRRLGGTDQNGASEPAVPTRSMTLSAITMPEGEAGGGN